MSERPPDPDRRARGEGHPPEGDEEVSATAAGEGAALGVQLDAALGDAYRRLAMRDRTEAEIRSCLGRRGHDPGIVEAAVGELHRQRYLDDARFVRRFAEDRRSLDGWGSERIRRRLAELGVAEQLIDDAVAREPEDELAAAVEVLRRRLARPPGDERERRRALGLLVRRGFDLELAYDAVRRLEREPA